MANIDFCLIPNSVLLCLMAAASLQVREPYCIPTQVSVPFTHVPHICNSLNTGRLGSTIVNLSVPGEFIISRRGDSCDSIQVCISHFRYTKPHNTAISHCRAHSKSTALLEQGMMIDKESFVQVAWCSTLSWVSLTELCDT